jgi:KDO2-lipid IV(A) lauroyltransferase
MQKLVHAIVYYTCIPFLYFFSILPWPVLFLFSDVFFLILYYILGYRRKIVRINLSRSFPEKSAKELKMIEFRFFRYFTDMIFEMFKLFTMSPAQKLERCRIDTTSLALVQELHSKQKKVIMVMGHYGNWEYCPTGLPLQSDYQAYVIYHPLSNPYFDHLMSRMRTSTGCKLYTMTGTLKGMITNRNEIDVTAFVSDQSADPAGAYWTQFLNQDTAIFTGSEKMARKFHTAVIYGSLERIKRGKYIFHLKLVCEDASKTQEGEITEAHVRLLENDIRENPEYWLWTHRRWKYQRQEAL